jgi:hypothetical protein
MLNLMSTALMALLALQAKDADLVSKADLGMSMRRPPKNDEWDAREKGSFFSNSQLCVAHKVDSIAIEVFEQDKATGFGYYNIKDAANGEYKNIAGFKGLTDSKKLVASNQKLPGGGAGNVMASYLEMTFKKEDKPMELRMWVFIGKNQNLYKVLMTCDEGMYKKHQKEVDYILGSIDIFKVK